MVHHEQNVSMAWINSVVGGVSRSDAWQSDRQYNGGDGSKQSATHDDFPFALVVQTLERALMPDKQDGDNHQYR